MSSFTTRFKPQDRSNCSKYSRGTNGDRSTAWWPRPIKSLANGPLLEKQNWILSLSAITTFQLIHTPLPPASLLLTPRADPANTPGRCPSPCQRLHFRLSKANWPFTHTWKTAWGNASQHNSLILITLTHSDYHISQAARWVGLVINLGTKH